jgi:hypothetical protein
VPGVSVPVVERNEAHTLPRLFASLRALLANSPDGASGASLAGTGG